MCDDGRTCAGEPLVERPHYRLLGIGSRTRVPAHERRDTRVYVPRTRISVVTGGSRSRVTYNYWLPRSATSRHRRYYADPALPADGAISTRTTFPRGILCLTQ